MSDFDLKEYDRLQKEYKKRFGDTYPVMFESDPIAEIKKCLKEGKPFDLYESTLKKTGERIYI